MSLHLRRPFHWSSSRIRPSWPSVRKPRSLSCSSLPHPHPKFRRPYTSVMIVPTGVGASIGGFAGDALPAARTLASVVDCLISHPNVETWIDPKDGKSRGRIKHPDSLLRAVHTLVSKSQVNAVAVVGRFPDEDIGEVEDYRQGKVSPRSAAEEIGHTFLPCVLAGLSGAPQYTVRKPGTAEDGVIVACDVDSIVLPNDACGGDGALAFARSPAKNRPLIISVQENETVLDDTPDKLGIEAVKVSNYWEAIGVIAAHKAGVDPKALRRQGISTIKGSSISSPINHGASVPLQFASAVYSS